MDTTTKTTHTPGAIRAAWDIMDVRNKIRTRSGLLTQTELAVLIDRETGVAALLEACRLILQRDDANESLTTPDVDVIEAAIAAATGEDQ